MKIADEPVLLIVLVELRPEGELALFSSVGVGKISFSFDQKFLSFHSRLVIWELLLELDVESAPFESVIVLK